MRRIARIAPSCAAYATARSSSGLEPSSRARRRIDGAFERSSAEPIASSAASQSGAIWRKWARRAAATTSAPSVSSAAAAARFGGPSAAATHAATPRTAAGGCAASEKTPVLVSRNCAPPPRSTSRPRTGDARAAARGARDRAAAGERERRARAVVAAAAAASDCTRHGGSAPRRRRPRSPPARAHRSCARRARGARGTASYSRAPSSAATTAPAAASASSVQSAVAVACRRRRVGHERRRLRYLRAGLGSPRAPSRTRSTMRSARGAASSAGCTRRQRCSMPVGLLWARLSRARAPLRPAHALEMATCAKPSALRSSRTAFLLWPRGRIRGTLIFGLAAGFAGAPCRTSRVRKEDAHDDGIWSRRVVGQRPDRDGLVRRGGADVHGARPADREDARAARPPSASRFVSVSAEGNLAASSALDSHIRLWDLDKGEEVRTIDAGPVEAWTVAVSPDGATVASGSQGIFGNVNLWSVGSGEKAATLQGSFWQVPDVGRVLRRRQVRRAATHGAVRLRRREAEGAQAGGARAHRPHARLLARRRAPRQRLRRLPRQRVRRRLESQVASLEGHSIVGARRRVRRRRLPHRHVLLRPLGAHVVDGGAARASKASPTPTPTIKMGRRLRPERRPLRLGGRRTRRCACSIDDGAERRRREDLRDYSQRPRRSARRSADGLSRRGRRRQRYAEIAASEKRAAPSRKPAKSQHARRRKHLALHLADSAVICAAHEYCAAARCEHR